MFVLCCIWFIVAFLWITITSALDKEWMTALFPFSLVRFVAKKTRLVYVRHRAGYFRLLAVAVFSALSVLFVSRIGSSGTQTYKLPA